MLTTGLDQYALAFLHKSTYPEECDRNYENLEQLGDATANKSIVWYMRNRFPKQSVAVISRLKSKYQGTAMFAQFADRLGFPDFIKTAPGVPIARMIAEDVFEAFLGATELLANRHYSTYGVGGIAVYQIVTSLFNEIAISTDYKDLYDGITRLKQLAESTLPRGDKFRTVVGTVTYVTERSRTCGPAGPAGPSGSSGPSGMTSVTVVLTDPAARQHTIGSGSSHKKAISVELAAQRALLTLETWGYDYTG